LPPRAFLLDEAVTLLTLTGRGSVGKTRLSLAIAQDVADHFADGMAWVDLAPLTDASLVPVTVARALGREKSRRPRSNLGAADDRFAPRR
jgi:predicted ATPase